MLRRWPFDHKWLHVFRNTNEIEWVIQYYIVYSYIIYFIFKANHNDEIPIKYYLDCPNTHLYGKYNYFPAKNFQTPIRTSECAFQGIIPVSVHKLSSYNTGFIVRRQFYVYWQMLFLFFAFLFRGNAWVIPLLLFFHPPGHVPKLRTAYLVNQCDAVGFWCNRTNKWNIIQNLGEILMLLPNP